MKVVVDASGLAAVAIGEPGAVLRELVIATVAEQTLTAPATLPLELAGSIAKAEWMGRLDASASANAWGWARRVVTTFELDSAPDPNAVFTTCRNHRLRGAEACYLELAMRTRRPLLTADKQLARAAKDAAVELLFNPDA